MEDSFLEKIPLGEGCSETLVKLIRGDKIISCAACLNPPFQVPAVWDITSLIRKDKFDFLSELPGFSLIPAYEVCRQQVEWACLLEVLRKHERVAISKLGSYEVYILPPLEDSNFDFATVLYREKKHRA